MNCANGGCFRLILTRVILLPVFCKCPSLPYLDFVHFVMPAQAPASQNGQSQRHFSMSSLDNDVEKYQAPNGAA
jgi:hypothetical protein